MHWPKQEGVKPVEVVKEESELVKRVQALWEEDKTQEAIAGMHELVAIDPTDYDLIGPHTMRALTAHTAHTEVSTDVDRVVIDQQRN